MNLTMKREVEVFEYRHKKFDRRKRSSDESEPDVEIMIDGTTIMTTSYAAGVCDTPSLYGNRKRRRMERADTPYSVSSETSSGGGDFLLFGADHCSSTPLAPKRRKLWPTLRMRRQRPQQQHQLNDSGIAMTPQKTSLLEHCGSVTDSPVTSRLRHSTHEVSDSCDVYDVTSTSPKRIRLQSSDSNGSSDVDVVTVTPAEWPATTTRTATAVSSSAPSPVTGVLASISPETLHKICKYNGNMVRAFPKKERTPKEQERRDKNTIACRVSRRLKKFEQVTIEEEYKACIKQDTTLVEQAIRSAAYLKQLIGMVATADNRTEHNNDDTDALLTSPNLTRKPFSIAYLTGI